MLRITGGYYKNSKIISPKGRLIRPTSDRVREALFNILAKRIEGSFFLDLFAGTGAVGVEALSRGAEKSIFIENNNHCVKIINENLKRLNLQEVSNILRGDVISLLNSKGLNINEKMDLIYCDPPYRSTFTEDIMNAIHNKKLLKREGLLIFEHSSKDEIEDSNFWDTVDSRRYGEAALTFLKEK